MRKHGRARIDRRSLDFAVRVSMASYSCIHPTRKHVIEHFYCVNGNGYEWQNGILVDVCDDKDHDAAVRCFKRGMSDERVREIFEARSMKNRMELRKKWVGEMRKLPDEFKQRLLDLSHDPIDHKFTIYPISEFSMVMTIPRNVRPDWLAGAEEAVRLIEMYPSDNEKWTMENRQVWIPRIRALIEERKKELEHAGK